MTAPRKLRAWQEECIEKLIGDCWRRKRRGLVTATPGAGKTTLALTLAQNRTSAPDAGKAQQALLLWDRATRRPIGSNQHAEGFDNVQALPLAPTGNSAAAGIRRLDREAEKGNEIAALALEQVKAGSVSVHAAMVECGFRKSTKIDRDVRDRAAQALAERIIACLPADELDAAKADAFASGARALGIALTNLIGQSIMDRRHG